MVLISRKLCRFLFYVLTGFTSFIHILFFLFRSLSPFSCTVFDAASANMNLVLSINQFVNVFLIGNFNVHHKDWLIYFMELIDLANSVITFLFQMTLLRWLLFWLGSLTVTLVVLLFCFYLFPLMLVFYLQRLSLLWKILTMLLSQFWSQKWILFIAELMTILVLIGMVFVIIR